MEEVFKTIEDYPNYEFSNHGRMLNTKTGKFLTIDTNCFRLYKDGKEKRIALSKLKHKYFPEKIQLLEGEIFKTIQEYPNYEISSQNRLRNKTTNKFLKLHNNKFALHKDGKIKTLALSKLKHKYFPEPIEYLPGEIFLIIEGFPNYEISNRGRVYNNDTGTFLTPHIGTHGYYYVILYKNNKKKFFRIHRLVAIAFIPNPKNLPCIDHINRIKTDNRLENLRWVSSSENNINSLQIREYPKHICKKKKGNYEHWRIIIDNKLCKYDKTFSCKEYTLEKVKEIRNKVYKEHGITVLD